MRGERFFIMLAIAAMVLVYPLTAFASDITLDGSFNDWRDKPGLDDVVGDEQPESDIVAVKWFPDASGTNLYLYCERLEKGDKKYDEDYDERIISDIDIYNDVFSDNRRFRYWVLTVDFSSDLGNRTAHITYQPPSRKVYVQLYDADGSYIWSANGKWGEDKDTGRRIEFYIPFSKLTSSTAAGYQVDLSFMSGSDQVPDSGAITISTISTFPWLTATVAVLLAAAGFITVKLNKRKAEKKGVS